MARARAFRDANTSLLPCLVVESIIRDRAKKNVISLCSTTERQEQYDIDITRREKEYSVNSFSASFWAG